MWISDLSIRRPVLAVMLIGALVGGAAVIEPTVSRELSECFDDRLLIMAAIGQPRLQSFARNRCAQSIGCTQTSVGSTGSH